MTHKEPNEVSVLSDVLRGMPKGSSLTIKKMETSAYVSISSYLEGDMGYVGSDLHNVNFLLDIAGNESSRNDVLQTLLHSFLVELSERKVSRSNTLEQVDSG